MLEASPSYLIVQASKNQMHGELVAMSTIPNQCIQYFSHRRHVALMFVAIFDLQRMMRFLLPRPCHQKRAAGR
jgi:hypothetical protein